VSGTPNISPLIHIVYAIQAITPMKRRGTDTLPIGACFFFFTKACKPSRLGPRDFDMPLPCLSSRGWLLKNGGAVSTSNAVTSGYCNLLLNDELEELESVNSMNSTEAFSERISFFGFKSASTRRAVACF
jgi:hypothetical protein